MKKQGHWIEESGFTGRCLCGAIIRGRKEFTNKEGKIIVKQNGSKIYKMPYVNKCFCEQCGKNIERIDKELGQ